MVVINPAIKKQLKDLQKIPYGRVKNESAIIVDLPIGQLKTHDLARALFITTHAFADIQHRQRIIIDVIHTAQEEIQKVLENKSLKKDEIISQIKKIVLDPVEKIDDLRSSKSSA